MLQLQRTNRAHNFGTANGLSRETQSCQPWQCCCNDLCAQIRNEGECRWSKMRWNSMMALSKARSLRLTLITCSTFDIVQGRWLDLKEKFALATKPNRCSKDRWHEPGGLPDEVELAVAWRSWSRLTSLRAWTWQVERESIW